MLGVQFVVRIQCRHLVTLGQSGIVEGRRQEVVQPPAESQHGLPDVDQLGGAGADHMNAKQAMIFSMKEHLQQAAVVAEDTVLYLLTCLGRCVGGNAVQCYGLYP